MFSQKHGFFVINLQTNLASYITAGLLIKSYMFIKGILYSFLNYFIIKNLAKLQRYLKLNISKDSRRMLTKLRISAHSLAIETGRYGTTKIPADQRFCKFCPHCCSVLSYIHIILILIYLYENLLSFC
jgi:hypothetical protein